MNSRIFIASLSLAAGLCTAGLSLADTPIYKWVDDQGRVHYSTEPHGDKAKQLAIQNQGDNAAPPATTAPGAASAANAAAADQAKADMLLATVKPNDSVICQNARIRFAKYLQASSLYKMDDKGNQVPVSADEKAQAFAELRANVNQACKDGGAK